MPFKLTYKTKEEVPAELQDYAKEVKAEGSDEVSFVVALEPATKLSEFRDNNVSLAKSNEELKAKASILDKILGEDQEADAFITELGELRGLKQQVDDGKIKGADNIETEVNKRVEAMKRANEETVQNLQRENAGLKDALTASDNKFKMSVIDTAIMSAASDPDVGVNMKAMPHILNAARQVFVVEEENGRTNLKPQDTGGNTLFGEDGSSPMTVTEWFKKLKETDPFFFLGSTGGGAGGGDGKAEYGGMSQVEFQKLSPQEKLRIANRQAQ